MNAVLAAYGFIVNFFLNTVATAMLFKIIGRDYLYTSTFLRYGIKPCVFYIAMYRSGNGYWVNGIRGFCHGTLNLFLP